MKKTTRRALLTASVGLSQLLLLDRFGLGPRRALAGSSGPTRMLTVYVPGGWMPIYLWNPLGPKDIQKLLPPAKAVGANGEDVVYFNADQVTNLDGSGDADLGAPFQRLRVPRTWNEAELQKLAQGDPSADPKAPVTPGIPSMTNGWSWAVNKLWENTCVVHGVDQGTAAHDSGRISAMCGAAGPEYRAPGVQTLVANALATTFPDRPLPCVTIGDAPVPASLSLPAIAAATTISSLDSLDYTLSRNKDSAWKGLRDTSDTPQVDFAGKLMGSLQTNPMDEFVLRSTRKLRGQTNDATDALYEQIYDRYQGVSKLLARDVVSTLSAAKGVEHSPQPYWAPYPTPWALNGNGRHVDNGSTWSDGFDLALRLLKTDLASAVVVNCYGIGHAFLDTHGAEETQFDYARTVFEVLGRLFGEMKLTPSPSQPGKSLLDDTLVLVVSEFARTWPTSNSDHWPITSVAFLGGGVVPNRMVGNYLTDGTNVGAPASVVEGGQMTKRPLRSGDVIETTLRVMGVEQFSIPGGSGEIVGVRPG